MRWREGGREGGEGKHTGAILVRSRDTGKNREKRRRMCVRLRMGSPGYGGLSSGGRRPPPCIKAFFCRRRVQSFSLSYGGALRADYLRGSSSPTVPAWPTCARGRCPAEREPALRGCCGVPRRPSSPWYVSLALRIRPRPLGVYLGRYSRAFANALFEFVSLPERAIR